MVIVHKMTVNGFEDLRIWQAAHELALRVYGVTSRFPASEAYGLTSQLRRAAASVSANIAEGYGRFSKAEYLHFLYYARGSLMETKSFLYLARDAGYLESGSVTEIFDTMDKLGVSLNNTIKTIRQAKVAVSTESA